MMYEDKLALHTGSCTIKTKLVVGPGTEHETVLTETDSIKSWEHTEERYVPDIGFIGQFVARELTGELHNISDDFSIENENVELQFAIVRKNNNEIIETWYSLGLFIIMEPDDDDVKDNTTFEAFDMTVLFNKEFNPHFVDDVFTTSFGDVIKNGGSFTALELAKYACAQVNIELGSETFTNHDFPINTNQFIEGNSCRDVMKAISQLAFGWCRIGWDNKLYIDEITTSIDNVTDLETLSNDQYYSLHTKTIPFGPVNRVYIGPSNIEGEGVVTPNNDSTEAIGDIVINIYDNPITYTPALRTLALNGAEKLFGIEYLPFEVETIGHPWFKANEPIIVIDMENNTFRTYPFRVTTKYTGHIKTTISAIEKTVANKENGYNETLYKSLHDVMVIVNKQEGTISLLSSRTQATEDGLGVLETRVEQNITDTYSRTEIDTKLVDGSVTKVMTTSGTFDENGMHYEKTDAPTSSTINERGVRVDGTTSGEELLFAGYDDTIKQTIVRTENLTVRKYLVIGDNSRIENYGNGGGIFII